MGGKSGSAGTMSAADYVKGRSSSDTTSTSTDPAAITGSAETGFTSSTGVTGESRGAVSRAAGAQPTTKSMAMPWGWRPEDRIALSGPFRGLNVTAYKDWEVGSSPDSSPANSMQMATRAANSGYGAALWGRAKKPK